MPRLIAVAAISFCRYAFGRIGRNGRRMDIDAERY